VKLSSHWGKKAVNVFIFLMISTFVWSVVDGLGFMYPEAASRMWWYRINYLSAAWIGLFLFYFVRSLVDTKPVLDKRYYLLAIFPVIMTFLVFTNDFHHLVWQDLRVVDNGRLSVPVYSHAPGFWATIVFSYGLVFWACMILIHALKKSRGRIKQQLMLVLAGILSPLVFSILYAFGSETFRQIDFTPLAFSFSGIFFIVALQRYQMLNLIPFIHKIVIENMTDPVIVLDRNYQIIDANPAAKNSFGIKDDFLNGVSFKDSLPQLYEQIISLIQHTPLETQISFQTGPALKHWNLSLSVLEKKKNHQIGWLIILKDITARKTAQDALLESGRLHRLVLEISPNPIAFYNKKLRPTYINPAFSRVFGWEPYEILGNNIHFVPEDILALTRRNVDEIFRHPGKNHNFVSRRHTKSGEVLDVNISAVSFCAKGDSPDSMVVNYTDITHIKKAEEIVIQSEKMLSVGGLAAGMAHEINNPLAGILQNNQVIMDRLTRDLPANVRAAENCGLDLEKMRDYLEQREIFVMMDLIRASGLQAAKIVANMLSFSRKSEKRKDTHYLHDILDDTIEMVSSDYNMKKNYDFRLIEIVREYQTGVPPVPCEKNEIQQVFLNILKNGAEAMADAGVALPRYILRSSYIRNEVVIEIEDNGPGMADATQNRIFEPFFTTKEVGSGIGLGLSVSYFIISKNHGGALSVESVPDKGTTFFIKIPAQKN